MNLCEVDGCESPRKKKQWCNMHYLRWWRNGDPLITKKTPNRTDEIEYTCIACDVTKPKSEFYDRGMQCRLCTAEKSKVWKASDTYRAKQYARLYQQRRRAHKNNAEICDFTVEQWQEVLSEHDGKCVYCGTTERITQEHIVPLSRGGNHTKSNIEPACLSCNTRKHTKTKAEFLATLEEDKHGDSRPQLRID